jgi:hypothetical protein
MSKFCLRRRKHCGCGEERAGQRATQNVADPVGRPDLKRLLPQNGSRLHIRRPAEVRSGVDRQRTPSTVR